MDIDINTAVIDAPPLEQFLKTWRDELEQDKDRVLLAAPLCNRLLQLHDYVEGPARKLVEDRLQANLGRTIYKVDELQSLLLQVQQLSEETAGQPT